MNTEAQKNLIRGLKAMLKWGNGPAGGGGTIDDYSNGRCEAEYRMKAELRRLLKEFESAAVVPCSGEWISVSKELPPLGEAVWLWDATDETGFIGWSMKNDEGGEWWESAVCPPGWDAEEGEWNVYDDNIGNIEPTHWMPLPIPPK